MWSIRGEYHTRAHPEVWRQVKQETKSGDSSYWSPLVLIPTDHYITIISYNPPSYFVRPTSCSTKSVKLLSKGSLYN